MRSETPLEPASKRALDAALLQDQLSRLGNSPYELGSVTADLRDPVFVPASLLNQLRRSAVDAGPTVQDLARALIRQAGPSTRPEGIVLDGHPGVTLDVTIPPDIDLSRCTGDEYSLWRTERRGDGALTQDTPGLVNRLWILDVDGTRLVLVADLFPDQPAALHQELTTIAESVHFEPTGS